MNITATKSNPIKSRRPVDTAPFLEPALDAFRLSKPCDRPATHNSGTHVLGFTNTIVNCCAYFNAITITTTNTFRSAFWRPFAGLLLLALFATPVPFSLAFQLAAAGGSADGEAVEVEATKQLTGVDLNRNGQTSLSDSEARRLATYVWDRLFLADVTDISDEAIAELAKHPGGLVLRALPDVSLDAAKALSRHEGMLNIGGHSLSDDVVELLSRNKGSLGLDSLKTLTDSAASSLAENHAGILDLNGVINLTPSAAKSLATHKGGVGLYGVETLSVAAAAALAESTHDITLLDQPSFTPEIRLALSGHCGRITISGLDLPQYFNPDDGWFAESNSGFATRHIKLITAAIQHALGQESNGDGLHRLNGLEVGAKFRKIVEIKIRPDTDGFDPTRLLMSWRGDGRNLRPGETMYGRVDSLTGDVIGVEKEFRNTSLANLIDSVVESFGRTPQELLEFQSSSGRQTIVRYTLPNELVRIRQVEFLGKRELPCVVMSLTSKPWVKQNLRAYGNAFLRASEWVSHVIGTIDGDVFDLKQMRPLPGTTVMAELNHTHALLVDERRARLLRNREGILGPEAGKSFVSVSPFVAAVGNVDGMPVVIVQPLNSTVAGFRPLLTRNQYGSEADMRHVDCTDLLMELVNFLAQAEFPPATDKISVVRRYSDVRRFPVDGRGGVKQINSLFDATQAEWRYEWLCENGWTVRAMANGTLCLFRQGK